MKFISNDYSVWFNEYKTKHWHKDGKRHREDGPAAEYADGDRYWYQHGKFHRDDGPAIEYANGNKGFFISRI